LEDIKGHNPYIEGQTTQWPKEKFTKHYTKYKRSSNTNATKNQGWTLVLRKG